jgi:hypothetical protein
VSKVTYGRNVKGNIRNTKGQKNISCNDFTEIKMILPVVLITFIWKDGWMEKSSPVYLANEA